MIAFSGLTGSSHSSPIISREIEFPSLYQKPRQVWIENLDTIDEDKRGIIDLHPDVFACLPRIDIVHKNIKWQRMYKFVVSSMKVYFKQQFFQTARLHFYRTYCTHGHKIAFLMQEKYLLSSLKLERLEIIQTCRIPNLNYLYSMHFLFYQLILLIVYKMLNGFQADRNISILEVSDLNCLPWICRRKSYIYADVLLPVKTPLDIINGGYHA